MKTPTLTIVIRGGNTAVQSKQDMAVILRDLSDKLVASHPTATDHGNLMDYNGNKVGEWLFR